MKHPELIVVLDFGSQYSQLIARRVRELGVYAELHPFSLTAAQIAAMKPAGVIFSGGPASVYDDDAPRPDPGLYKLGIPILGICYGLQLIGYQLGGEVDPSAKKEYGPAELLIDDATDLFAGVNGERKGDAPYIDMYTPPQEIATRVWMSHGDTLVKMPPGFARLAHSANSPLCAIADRSKKIFGVQFHPEVVHTIRGKKVLSNFLFTVCGAKGGWNAGSFIDAAVEDIRAVTHNERVLCALSGGVDSSVLAVLLHKAIGDRLTCVHIDTGLMRKNESEAIVALYRDAYKFHLVAVDASDEFVGALDGVTDPEQKRKIIGKTFIDVFEREAHKAGSAGFLAQGTLYPDVIESTSFRGPSHTIKTHHNVGGLPAAMKLKLVEPFRELFKDEVRAVGKMLGLPAGLIGRHPFPGPGLAVRILGSVTRERLRIVRDADEIFLDELKKAGLYDSVWQAFCVLLPVQTVGVMGDQRTYDHVIAIRAVESLDGMTADWAHLPHDLLAAASRRIVNEVRGVNRVVYDVTSKPPATIEWE